MPTIPTRYRSTTPPPANGTNTSAIPLDNATGQGKTESILPDVQEYLMDGFLYCQFEKLGADDGYADIDTPAITMEGRVE